MASALIHNVFGTKTPHVDRGEGVWLVDTDGNRYLDGSSGAVVANIGHGNRDVADAIHRQASAIAYTHRGAFGSAAIDALADRIAAMTGYDGVWFVNSGSEAVEACIQFAMQYFRETSRPERNWFLSHEFGFHGSTLGSLSLSGHTRRIVLGDLAYPFPQLPTPYAHRDGRGESQDEYAARLLAGARTQFEASADRLAGVVIEAVGGATFGATVPPPGYLAGIRALCDEFGVLMVVDEVMTGMGRTGTMLAVDHWEVRPDLVALGKGLGAGYTPIAAALVTESILEAIANGSGRITGGHTYAGNPLSIATATAVLDVLDRDDVIAIAAANAEHLAAGLADLHRSHPLVADARGLGMLRALELAEDPEPATGPRPQGQLGQLVVRAAATHGVIIYAATGGFNEALLVAPPLTITREEIDFLVSALDSALSDVEEMLDLDS